MHQLVIRAEASEKIGLGHIKRCLTLARAIKGEDLLVQFAGTNHLTRQIAEDSGFPFIYIKDNRDFISFLEEELVSIVIIDNYDISEDELKMIKALIPVVAYVDDLCAFDYPVDIVINGNINAEYLPYPKPSSKKLLLGPKYNMISEVYSNLPMRKVSLMVEKIMITTGGTDNYNLTETLIHWIRGTEEFSSMELHVVIGSGFKNREVLKSLMYTNVYLYENLNDLSGLMRIADMAISSSGSTLYELCASGVPTLSVIIADNQADIANHMNKNGLVKCMGWYHNLDKDIVVNEIKSLCDSYAKRADMIEKQQLLLDGKGVNRIVNEILEELYKN